MGAARVLSSQDRQATSDVGGGCCKQVKALMAGKAAGSSRRKDASGRKRFCSDHTSSKGDKHASMPRINPKDFLRARAISNALVSLLPVCRDLRSAQNELRWMRQHAINVSQTARVGHERVLHNYVVRRAQGEPLQYILGSEFFGDLEIRCRPGVLIPRFDILQYLLNSDVNLISVLI